MKSGAVVRPLLVIAAILSRPALAGVAYDISGFTAADLDASGDLSKLEFNTTLPPGLTPKVQARSFRRADLNRNATIQLNEFLIFRGIIRPENALERWFYLADASLDGALDFEEYKSGFKRKASLVSIRRDFLRTDANGNGAVTLVEYSNFRLGLSRPNSFTVFELADFDDNGQLTIEEFGHVYTSTTSKAAIQKRFLLLDDNRDGVLTTSEWNPGVVR